MRAVRLTAVPVYDRSKAAGEAALRQVIDRGLEATIVNPSAVIGPYDFGPSRMGWVFLALFGRRLPGGPNLDQVLDASKMLPIESFSDSSNSLSLITAVRPSVNAREKLATTPLLRDSLAQASWRL